MPVNARPNGIAHHRGWLYVADSGLARVWRVHSDGQSPAEILTATRCCSTRPRHRRGFQGQMACKSSITRSTSPSSAAHTSWPSHQGEWVGRPRPRARRRARSSRLRLRREGKPVAMTNFFNTVVRVTPDGLTKLADLDDRLDGPSSGAFGVGQDKKSLYIANAAIPGFPGQNSRLSSVMGCISGSLGIAAVRILAMLSRGGSDDGVRFFRQWARTALRSVQEPTQ